MNYLNPLIARCRINRHKLDRFVKAVNSSDSVELFHHKGVNFVTVNSMAMEGDGCDMCAEAERQLAVVSQRLRCSQVRIVADKPELENRKITGKISNALHVKKMTLEM